MNDSTTSSSFGAYRRSVSEESGGSPGVSNSRPNKKQTVSNGSGSSSPRLSSRKKGDYALLTNESASETVSGKEDQYRPAKMTIGKRLSDIRTHSNPYRTPPAAPLRFASPRARAVPS